MPTSRHCSGHFGLGRRIRLDHFRQSKNRLLIADDWFLLQTVKGSQLPHA
jgi:hypothetical protein